VNSVGATAFSSAPEAVHMCGARTRRAFVAAAAVAFAGCTGTGDGDETPTTTGAGGDETTASNPVVGDVTQSGDLRLASPAFQDGEPIPRKYGYDAENVNPPLAAENVPADATTLTLVMDDPDAVEPAGEVWLHWLVWNVPADTTTIPEDWSPEAATEGVNDFDERGYGGPAPPDEAHTYRFKLYAVDTRLDVSADASKREVGRAMRGNVLAQTQLTGTYAPS
jgi:Raf kinase inhibitor-like YbhB/YbcL family protein